MVKKEYNLSWKQKMNMEQKSIETLLIKLCEFKLTDEEKLKYIDGCIHPGGF